METEIVEHLYNIIKDPVYFGLNLKTDLRFSISFTETDLGLAYLWKFKFLFSSGFFYVNVCFVFVFFFVCKCNLNLITTRKLQCFCQGYCD